MIKILLAAYRIRTRVILTSSAKQDGCPHSLESRQCHLPACYRWHIRYAPCQLSYEDMECGVGTKSAVVVCKDLKQVPETSL